MSKIFTPADMLADLVAFDTTSRNSNLALIEFVQDFLRDHGIHGELFLNHEGTKGNLFATIGPTGRPGVILSGHTDVVPVDGQDWRTDPFRLTEQNGRLYGRGSCDMKGFIATVLALVPEFARARLQRPLHLAFSYDEEVACTGVASLVAHVAQLQPRPMLCIVGEPTLMQVVNSHKGIHCFATTVTGREAHSSQTHRGVNAIEVAMKLIAHLGELAEQEKRRADPRFDPPFTSISVGMIDGGTAINIVPRQCRFEWECRPLPDADPGAIHTAFTAYADSLLPHLRALAPGVDIVTERTATVPPLTPDPGGAAETLVLRLAQANATHAVAFGTEAGHFRNDGGVPTMICGPGSIAQAHQPDEYVEIAQLDACAAFLRRLTGELEQD